MAVTSSRSQLLFYLYLPHTTSWLQYLINMQTTWPTLSRHPHLTHTLETLTLDPHSRDTHTWTTLSRNNIIKWLLLWDAGSSTHYTDAAVSRDLVVTWMNETMTRFSLQLLAVVVSRGHHRRVWHIYYVCYWLKLLDSDHVIKLFYALRFTCITPSATFSYRINISSTLMNKYYLSYISNTLMYKHSSLVHNKQQHPHA